MRRLITIATMIVLPLLAALRPAHADPTSHTFSIKNFSPFQIDANATVKDLFFGGQTIQLGNPVIQSPIFGPSIWTMPGTLPDSTWRLTYHNATGNHSIDFDSHVTHQVVVTR